MTAILIVGATHTINDRLEELINEHRSTYSTSKVTKFSAALAAINEQQPSVVLLSNNLPEKEVLELIKQTTRSKGAVQLIILDNDSANKDLLKKMGAEHIIDIYHDFDMLPALVKQLISSKKTSRF